MAAVSTRAFKCEQNAPKQNHIGNAAPMGHFINTTTLGAYLLQASVHHFQNKSLRVKPTRTLLPSGTNQLVISHNI